MIPSEALVFRSLSFLWQRRNCSRKQVPSHSELRHSLLDLTLHLFDVDVQSIAIDRTMRLEVEDSCERVAADRLLVDSAFNRIDRILVGLIPLLREVWIFPLPARASSVVALFSPYTHRLTHAPDAEQP